MYIYNITNIRIPLHCILSYFIAIHFTSLHWIALNFIELHDLISNYTTSHCITSHHITSHACSASHTQRIILHTHYTHIHIVAHLLGFDGHDKTWEEPKRKAVLFLARCLQSCAIHKVAGHHPRIAAWKPWECPATTVICNTSGKKAIHPVRKFMITHILADTNNHEQ